MSFLSFFIINCCWDYKASNVLATCLIRLVAIKYIKPCNWCEPVTKTPIKKGAFRRLSYISSEILKIIHLLVLHPLFAVVVQAHGEGE